MATNTLLRSLHDLGLASWFGGTLMGTTGVRAAAASGRSSPVEEAEDEMAGWDAWQPVALASIAAHAVGGIGLIIVNRNRHRRQEGVMGVTVLKAAVTGLALASTAGQGILGRRLPQVQRDADSGDTAAKEQVERLRRQARTLALATPVLTGAVVVLAAREGELQRTSAHLAGTAARLADRARAAFDTAREGVGTVVDELPGGLENLKDLKDAVLDRTGLAA